MVNGRYYKRYYKRTRRNGYGSTRKTYAYGRKNLYKLQKQIGAVKRMVLKGSSPHRYLGQVYDGRANHDATNPYRIIPLNNWRPYNATTEPYGKFPLFGLEESDINDSKKMVWKSTNIRCKLDLTGEWNTEEETVDYDIFIVSLKDNASDLMDRTTGTLGPLVGNLHYFEIAQKLHYVNKEIFNVHFHKHIVLGNNGEDMAVPTSLVNHTFRYFNYKIKPGLNGVDIVANVSNNWVNWRSVNHSQDPSKNYYMLLFSDDQNIDQESVHLSMTAISKIKNTDD